MKKIYQIYIDNLKKGVSIKKELESLENGIKQMENKTILMQKEIENLQYENNKFRERLQISPQGDDRIDELEETIKYLKLALDNKNLK